MPRNPDVYTVVETGNYESDFIEMKTKVLNFLHEARDNGYTWCEYRAVCVMCGKCYSIGGTNSAVSMQLWAQGQIEIVYATCETRRVKLVRLATVGAWANEGDVIEINKVFC